MALLYSVQAQQQFFTNYQNKTQDNLCMTRGSGNSIEPKVDKLVAFCKLNVALDALL